MSTLLCSAAFAQDWHLTGSDAGQSGWQKSERKLAPDTVPTKAGFLWKIQLGKPAKDAEDSFSEPLLAGSMITARGFKDFVYWSSGDTVYAVDSELGDLLWQKQFPIVGSSIARGCRASRLSLLMEPPRVIHFGAHRQRTGGARSSSIQNSNTPLPPGERRFGGPPGGNSFVLKGIYVLTQDGMLHEQVSITGADWAPPVKFLPSSGGDAYGLNINGHTIYTATGRSCSGVPNGVWAIDLASPNDAVSSYSTQKIGSLSLTGPVIDADGTAYLVTGAGKSDSNGESHANSVVAIDPEMNVKDWYTPSSGMGKYQYVSPIAFAYKDKQLIAAPGKDGSIVLLDAESLGGADHHTPLSEVASVTKLHEKHSWDGFATWQDNDGATWVFASVSAGMKLTSGSVKLNGEAPHGGIVAFKVDDSSGQPVLKPVWVSRDMVNPAPPRIANGVLIALSRGNASTHAALYMLNAATGAELYSSKDLVPTYAGLSGVAVGGGHIFFTDHENVLYSFGIAIPH